MIIAGLPLRNRSMRRAATAAVAGLATITIAGIIAPADARKSPDKKPIEILQSRPAGPPVMAIVSLRDQRVTVYDADGWIMRAPVSSGRKGYETPAGIYSVIQKEAEHYSNLYDDASMPFMQRITWSGIALHAGALPGYPASHGCIRMPEFMAENFFKTVSTGTPVTITN